MSSRLVRQIDKESMEKANLMHRLIWEVEIHAQLRHPCVLALLTVFEDECSVYIVTELCEEGELYRKLKNLERPLTEPEAAKIGKQIAEGLRYLHSHGIIHRDLKLSNILLTKDLDVVRT
jgi:polo-like kinase 4